MSAAEFAERRTRCSQPASEVQPGAGAEVEPALGSTAAEVLPGSATSAQSTPTSVLTFPSRCQNYRISLRCRRTSRESETDGWTGFGSTEGWKEAESIETLERTSWEIRIENSLEGPAAEVGTAGAAEAAAADTAEAAAPAADIAAETAVDIAAVAVPEAGTLAGTLAGTDQFAALSAGPSPAALLCACWLKLPAVVSSLPAVASA